MNRNMSPFLVAAGFRSGDPGRVEQQTELGVFSAEDLGLSLDGVMGIHEWEVALCSLHAWGTWGKNNVDNPMVEWTVNLVGCRSSS
jgi:hypothetical protein